MLCTCPDNIHTPLPGVGRFSDFKGEEEENMSILKEPMKLLTWGFLEYVSMIMKSYFRAGDKFLADPINMWPPIDGSKNPDRETF